jgi:molybdopterin converting factor small subunit
MTVRVKIIGPLMYEAGFSEKDVDVPESTTVEALLDLVAVPRQRPKIVTRNGRAVTPEEHLADGDKIAISPIYSGG